MSDSRARTVAAWVVGGLATLGAVQLLRIVVGVGWPADELTDEDDGE